MTKASGEVSLGKVVVLCIEDDPDIRQIVRLALTLDAGITLYEAASASAAEDMLVTRGKDIDLVLLDVSLPDSKGCDLVNLVQHHCSGSQVIFFTAACRRADVNRYRESGANGLIYKPFDPIALSKHIRVALVQTGEFYIVG